MFRRAAWGVWGRVAVAAVLLPLPAQAETFDNAAVIALVRADIGNEVLLSKIRALPCGYDVSTGGLIRLRQAGVANVVIREMVNRCAGSARAQGGTGALAADAARQHPAGIYLATAGAGGADAALQPIRPTRVNGVQTGGNGSLLFPRVARVSVPQPAAQIVAGSATPVFWFYFDPADRLVGDFGNSASDAAQSPAEFSLVRFRARANAREMVVGRSTPFGSTLGVDPKATIPFTMAEAGDGAFRVAVKTPLAPGEYAFILRAGSDSYRIYDFSVR